ncbi:MAG TPA: substrate-binding domain-containing protein [Clostridia bacterium]|nr:substrate-binding domain-containing protein [Clostridia bacterium]
MKSNKSYIIGVIAVQMILLPLLLTVGSFVYSPIANLLSDAIREAGLGNDVQKLSHVLALVLCTLLASGAVGYIYSRQSKTKPDSSKARYIAPLIPIIYAFTFAFLAAVFSKGDYNSGWWGVYIFKNPMFLIFDIFLAFTGMNQLIPVAELTAYTSFALGFLLQEQVAKSGIKDTASRNIKALLVALCLAVIVFTGNSNRDVIDNGIIEMIYGESSVGKDLTEYDLLEIAPFREDNGLAKLDKEASLQFKEIDDMPRLDGATAAYPVYAAFVEAVYKGLGDYYNANKNNNDKDIYLAFVDSNQPPFDKIKCSKTDKAYERLIDGQTDIIFVAEPSKFQNELIKAKGDEFVLTPIGYEAFVFFTNVKNPVESLTIGQIQDIYLGKVTNWKKVGGQNREVLPYQRPENSGSQTVMENKVMKDLQMMGPTKESLVEGMGGIIKEVASYKNSRNSIGYSFMYYSSSMIRNNQIKYIGVNGIKPTTETVRNRTYPFTVPVYAVTLKSNTKEKVSKLIEWILSEEGQSLIEKTGYVPAIK